VVNLLAGEPEYLDPIKDEVSTGWVVTGYPWNKINAPEHQAFLDAYQKKYNDYPRLGSVVGYLTIKSIAAGLAKARSTEPDALVTAFKGLAIDGPFGRFEYRASVDRLHHCACVNFSRRCRLFGGDVHIGLCLLDEFFEGFAGGLPILEVRIDQGQRARIDLPLRLVGERTAVQNR
jgi:Periplasmic binding protein